MNNNGPSGSIVVKQTQGDFKNILGINSV